MRSRAFGAPFAVRLAHINWLRLIASFLLTLTFLATIVGIAVWSGQRFQPPPVSFIDSQTVFIAEMFFGISYAAMGWLLATRLPRNPLGWIFLILGVTMALQLTVTFFVQEAHQFLRRINDPLLLAAWLGSSVHLPSIMFFMSVIFLRFPTGQPLTRRWRIFGLLALVGTLLIVLGIGLAPEGLAWYPTLPNIFAVSRSLNPVLPGLTLTGLVISSIAILGATSSMIVRYRRAVATERVQLRWIAAAVLILTIAGLPFVFARYALDVDYRSGEILLAAALLAGCLLPVAAAIAILRHRLYDIDLILKRALVYIPLTGILGGLYAAGVALFQRIFQAVTGDKSDAAVVIATLVLAGMFTPIRNSIQSFVDRHFKPEVAHADLEPAEDFALTLEQRVGMLERRLSRMEVGADPRYYDDP